MNIHNINKLINLLKSLSDDQFDMRYWLDNVDANKVTNQLIHNCGSVGCIGGWSNLLMINEERAANHDYTNPYVYQWLGITYQQSFNIFYTFRHGDNPITREFAICLLENLIETGEVNHEAAYNKLMTQEGPVT